MICSDTREERRVQSKLNNGRRNLHLNKNGLLIWLYFFYRNTEYMLSFFISKINISRTHRRSSSTRRCDVHRSAGSHEILKCQVLNQIRFF